MPNFDLVPNFGEAITLFETYRTDLIALLAMVGQTLRPELKRDGEKDYRTYAHLPLLDATLRFVDTVTGAGEIDPPVGRD